MFSLPDATVARCPLRLSEEQYSSACCQLRMTPAPRSTTAKPWSGGDGGGGAGGGEGGDEGGGGGEGGLRGGEGGGGNWTTLLGGGGGAIRACRRLRLPGDAYRKSCHLVGLAMVEMQRLYKDALMSVT